MMQEEPVILKFLINQEKTIFHNNPWKQRRKTIFQSDVVWYLAMIELWENKWFCNLFTLLPSKQPKFDGEGLYGRQEKAFVTKGLLIGKC